MNLPLLLPALTPVIPTTANAVSILPHGPSMDKNTTQFSSENLSLMKVNSVNKNSLVIHSSQQPTSVLQSACVYQQIQTEAGNFLFPLQSVSATPKEPLYVKYVVNGKDYMINIPPNTTTSIAQFEKIAQTMLNEKNLSQREGISNDEVSIDILGTENNQQLTANQAISINKDPSSSTSQEIKINSSEHACQNNDKANNTTLQDKSDTTESLKSYGKPSGDIIYYTTQSNIDIHCNNELKVKRTDNSFSSIEYDNVSTISDGQIDYPCLPLISKPETCGVSGAHKDTETNYDDSPLFKIESVYSLVPPEVENSMNNVGTDTTIEMPTSSVCEKDDVPPSSNNNEILDCSTGNIHGCYVKMYKVNMRKKKSIQLQNFRRIFKWKKNLGRSTVRLFDRTVEIKKKAQKRVHTDKSKTHVDIADKSLHAAHIKKRHLKQDKLSRTLGVQKKFEPSHMKGTIAKVFRGSSFGCQNIPLDKAAVYLILKVGIRTVLIQLKWNNGTKRAIPQEISVPCDNHFTAKLSILPHGVDSVMILPYMPNIINQYGEPSYAISDRKEETSTIITETPSIHKDKSTLSQTVNHHPDLNEEFPEVNDKETSDIACSDQTYSGKITPLLHHEYSITEERYNEDYNEDCCDTMHDTFADSVSMYSYSSAEESVKLPKEVKSLNNKESNKLDRIKELKEKLQQDEIELETLRSTRKLQLISNTKL